MVLRDGYSSSDTLKNDIIAHIRNVIGPIASPEQLYFVARLPKTRSGKIMRRLLKAIAKGDEIGDISTLENEAAVSEVQAAFEEVKQSIKKNTK